MTSDGTGRASLDDIVETLDDVGWNQSEAARRLNVHRNTIRRRLASDR